MASSNKDTIYVDIDDEITGIIDKVQASNAKVIALVLPKRAAVFQSIVNMKLLKRAADGNKKNIVLITSEAGLLPLAGAAGLHVAKTLTSKPEIPVSPDMDDDEEEVEEDEPAQLPDDEETLDKTKPVGQLAGAGAAADGVETLVLDDDVPPETEDQKPVAKKNFAPPKKDKKLKIPDFDRFRLLLILGALLLIVLIGGLIFAAKVLPKATISIKTDASAVDLSVPLNLSPTAKSLSEDDGVIPAKLAQQQKTYTQTVPTTGQKNNGNKASGSVTMSTQVCGSIPDGGPADVPAGTGLSANGLTYITQENTSFNLSGPPKGGCLNFKSDGSTTIIAQSGGSNYNGANVFTVAGRSDVSAKVASAVAGGTDNIVQTVNQNDINSAKSKIQAASDSDMKKILKGDLSKDNYYALMATYSSGTPAVTSSSNIGEVSNNVTVTETVTYTMFGVHKDDLQKLVHNAIKQQIDTGKQSILDDGIDSAAFNVDNLTPNGGQITMTTTATAGPDLNIDEIRQNAIGKKPAAVKSDLESNPDVTSVDVKLSPFWVSSVPGKTSKIKVDIAKPTNHVKSSSSSNGND